MSDSDSGGGDWDSSRRPERLNWTRRYGKLRWLPYQLPRFRMVVYGNVNTKAAHDLALSFDHAIILAGWRLTAEAQFSLTPTPLTRGDDRLLSSKQDRSA